MNPTLTKRARSMRLRADKLEGFCGEAMSYANYLVNMSLSTIVNFQIPKEI